MAARSAIESLDRDGVPELNPTNGPSGSFEMMNCLEILDLSEYVEEESHMLVDEGGNLATESQELAKMVRKAWSRILMRISSRYRGVLKHCTTAKQVWDKLESVAPSPLETPVLPRLSFDDEEYALNREAFE
eukprot:scaffold1844_cov403-Pavlova_lutheri.AAC.5